MSVQKAIKNVMTFPFMDVWFDFESLNYFIPFLLFVAEFGKDLPAHWDP